MNAIRSVWDWTEPLRDWFRGLFRGGRDADWVGSGITRDGLRVVLLGAAAVFAIALAAYLLRRWYTGRTADAEVEAVEAEAPPDLEDENVTADALPGDEWLVLADDLLAKGDRRLAVRALFLAGLARLGENGLINLARYKSNLDRRRRGLRHEHRRRRAHAAPEHAASFKEMVAAFERVWYGAHAAADDLIEAFRKHLTKVGTRV